MPLPVGVITATVSWGPLGDYLGAPFTAATVTVWAAGDITWSATGQPLMRSPLVVQGTTGTLALPATDQPGFINRDGPVTGWTYTALVESPGQVDRTVTFTLPTAGASGIVVDLDTLWPSTAESQGTTVSVPAILSVNGQTGPVVTITQATLGITAASVGALPTTAPATIRNPGAVTPVFTIRDAADAADVFGVTSAGAVSGSGGLTTGGAIATGSNSQNAFIATGASGGIRFGGTASQTFIQRIAAARTLATDSTWRVYTSNTAGRATASIATAGAMAYDTTLQKPIWSDGTNWRDAAGTIV